MFGVRAYVQYKNQSDSHKSGSNEPRRNEATSSCCPLVGKEGDKDKRAQERTEDGAEKYQRYTSASALGRVHISRRSSGEHHRADRSPDKDESPNHS
jgi:hypothetical protein